VTFGFRRTDTATAIRYECVVSTFNALCLHSLYVHTVYVSICIMSKWPHAYSLCVYMCLHPCTGRRQTRARRADSAIYITHTNCVCIVSTCILSPQTLSMCLHTCGGAGRKHTSARRADTARDITHMNTLCLYSIHMHSLTTNTVYLTSCMRSMCLHTCTGRRHTGARRADSAPDIPHVNALSLHSVLHTVTSNLKVCQI